MHGKSILITATGVLASALIAAPASGQFPIAEGSVCPDSRYAEFHACATSVTPAADLPRTSAGHPDFSGYWRRQSWAFENFEEHPETPDDFGGPSSVVDPPGDLVPIQPWAEERRQFNEDNYIHHNAACFLAGPAGTMYMTSRFQFLQDESMIAMVGEQLTAHPYRVVPFDGRPHIGDIPLWNGDPRGRWEGDTLVIESPNDNAVYLLDQRGRFITDEARIEERMTLIDADTIHYEATFDDPLVYTQPFTIAFAFRRDTAPNPEIWEEACYETNEDPMRLFRSQGMRTYPGMTGDEARERKAAWEASQQ
ncbi:MAG TPA: hypothetical protein VIV14_03300 [Gammaproteobacteria bacterium]